MVRTAVVLLVVAMSLSARARVLGPCRADAKRLCAGVKPGGGRVIGCLWKHRSELSPGCQQNARRIFIKWLQISAACYADTKTFCADVPPGGGRIAACLARHSAELQNPTCQAEVAKGKDAVKSFLPGVCLKDAQQWCPGIKPGEGRIRDCLIKNFVKLRRPCRMKVKRWMKK